MIGPIFRSTVVRKRFSSTVTYTSKPTPSKGHLHRRLPDDSFPVGYALTGFHCGIKKNKLPDLAIILSTSSRPTSAAGCFTRNAFKAAPVLISEAVLRLSDGRIRALVVNSGCANAVTGEQGLEDAWSMIRNTDRLLSPPPPTPSTLVMSTGVIGQKLPISKIIAAISSASDFGNNFQSWEAVAKAFMTTDMFPKLRSSKFTIRGKEYRLAGIDKGAGMIHPKMGPPSPLPAGSLHATLLGFILTDAPVSPPSLQMALDYAVDRSFNSISVDGDMSTNDTIIAMANGAANPDANEIDEASDSEAYEIFRNELTLFAQELAKLIVRDGEGATKLVTVLVEVISCLFLLFARTKIDYPYWSHHH
jgi:glutamate N-acetyltransferase / amino-acid N-acetyltransferase